MKADYEAAPAEHWKLLEENQQSHVKAFLSREIGLTEQQN